MSFFGKLRGNATSNGASSTTPAKKEQAAPPMTPLQKMLLDAGPLRSDGSDKFFGMENCLYYSVPFREAVINYPRRSPQESLEASLAKNLRHPDPNAPMEDPKPKQPTTPSAARNNAVSPGQQQKVEDKDSPEYKKKVAMHTLPLLETSDNAAGYGMKESLFTALKDIFEAVLASPERMGVIRPDHFLEILRREHEAFRATIHQDAHEFLNLLLNEVVANVEAETKRALLEADPQSDSEATATTDTSLTTTNGARSPNTNTRWVHELFEGTLTSETQCLTCEKVSQRDEVFLDLSVDLEQHASVTSCLRKFSEEEMLCERNKFHCDNCGGLQEAEKRMKIKRLPRVLALHLKRFKYTEDLQRLQKLFHRVVYPYHLRLFNTTDDAEDPDRLYELYAVVIHIGGGPYHGHYVAIIKTEDRGWLLFDDEMVEPVDKNYVRNFFGDRPGLACAYVLFYQETTFEAMQEELEKEGMPPKQDVSELKDMMPSQKTNGDIHRVHSSGADSNTQGANNTSTHPDNATSSPIPIPSSAPKSPFGALAPKKSDAGLKHRRAKEEKERKAAEKEKEKEKEKAEKLRRKEQEAKIRDDQKRRDAELKAVLQASKMSKAEEDRRHADSPKTEKENGFVGGGFASRFKMKGRSASQTKPHKNRQENSNQIPDVPPLPDGPATNTDNFNHTQSKESTPPSTDHSLHNAQNAHSAPTSDPQALPAASAVPKTGDRRDTLDNAGNPPNSKHGRFKLKKRSFSVF